MQEPPELKSLIILNEFTTRWFGHWESCKRTTPWLQRLIDELDITFHEKVVAEANNVKEQLFKQDILCILLLFAEVLTLVKKLSNNLISYLELALYLEQCVTKNDKLTWKIVKDQWVSFWSPGYRYWSKEHRFYQAKVLCSHYEMEINNYQGDWAPAAVMEKEVEFDDFFREFDLII